MCQKMFYFEILFSQKVIFVKSLRIFFTLYFWKYMLTFNCNFINYCKTQTCFFSALGLETEEHTKSVKNKICFDL